MATPWNGSWKQRTHCLITQQFGELNYQTIADHCKVSYATIARLFHDSDNARVSEQRAKRIYYSLIYSGDLRNAKP